MSSPRLQSRSDERGRAPGVCLGTASLKAAGRGLLKACSEKLTLILATGFVSEKKTHVKVNLLSGRSQQEAVARPGLGHPVPESPWNPVGIRIAEHSECHPRDVIILVLHMRNL